MTTRPERRHRVQTEIIRTPLSVLALTGCRFGFHFFGEALCEWLTLCPKDGPLPQISHVLGISDLPLS